MVDRLALCGDLRRLGLTAGMTVLVHASLRALGPDEGGPATVAGALIDVLGESGTVVVPTQTAWNSTSSPHYRDATAGMTDDQIADYRASIARFDPAHTPSSGMGVLAEYVRRMPGSARSAHPQTSFSAVGARANDLMRVHDLTCHLGDRSPLGALYQHDASVLLIGTGYQTCTAFHLAEYRQPELQPRIYECRVADAGSSPSRDGWISFEGIELDDSDFARLGADFERESGSVSRDVLGHASSVLFRIRPAVDYAVDWISRERRKG